MKLKQKQKYSYHGSKGSWHNVEATFSIAIVRPWSGYDHRCHDLLHLVLPRQSF